MNITSLFKQKPTEILFDNELIKNDFLEDLNILYYTNDNELLAIAVLDYKIKNIFNNGYKKIIINDYLYNKYFIKTKMNFVYQDEVYYKGILYNVDYQNKEIDAKFEFVEIDDLMFTTAIFKANEEILNELTKIGFKDFVLWHKLILIPREFINCKEDFYSKLDEIKITKEKPKLLIHSCCAPCSSYCLEFLKNYFDITIFYYNPNITPLDEYNKRLDYQKLLSEKLGGFDVVTTNYDYSIFKEAIKGLNDESEGGIRCFTCYEFRLLETCLYAKEYGFDYFSTTLSISPYKNSNKINEIGLRLQNKYNMKFLYSNFKLDDGYKRSIELSKKYDLYRQDYCGCEYSLKFHK